MRTTTSVLTSVLTVISFISLAQSVAPDSIIIAIESLPQCAQTIIFPCISNSKCNPADFLCICEELQRVHMRDNVAAACTYPELAQYDTFAANICHPKPTPKPTPPPYPPHGNYTIPYSTCEILIPTTCPDGSPTTIKSHIVKPPGHNYTTGPYTVPYIHGTGRPVPLTTCEVLIPTTNAGGVTITITSVIVRPVTSEYIVVPHTTAEVLVPATSAVVLIPATSALGEPSSVEVLVPATSAEGEPSTAEVLIPTIGSNGEPSILTSQVVAPVGPTSTAEPFTGAAAVFEFGSVYVGMLAVAIGLMGFMFAEL